MNKYIIINTTTDNLEDVKKIQNTLLNEKLASCVQISNITSHYSWDGKLEETNEYLIVIKTRKSLFSLIETRIKELHSYNTPEIISYDLTNVSKEYSKYIDENTIENSEMQV